MKGFCRSKLDAAADGTRCGEKKVMPQAEGGRRRAAGIEFLGRAARRLWRAAVSV